MIYPIRALDYVEANKVLSTWWWWHGRRKVKESNPKVKVNPFYEPTDSVRQVLSEKLNDGISNVSNYEKEESLMIADALEE